MRALLKNLGLAAAAGVVGYVGDHTLDVLTAVHVPAAYHVPLALAVGGAIGHWFPKPNQAKDDTIAIR